MKKALKSALRKTVKAMYPLIKAKRNIVNALFGKPLKHNKNRSSYRITEKTEPARRYNAVSQPEKQITATRVSYRQAAKIRAKNKKKTPLWKDKRVIAAVCALVVVITAVLSLSLPGSGDNVYAVNNDAKNSSNPADSALPSSAGKEYAVSSEETPDVTEGSVSGEVNGLMPQNTSTPGTSQIPTATPIPTITPVQTPIPTTGPDKSEKLIPKTHDSRIIGVQEKLMDLGYMEPDEPTDYYGPITQYSLELFQRKHNLKVDGHAGKETLTALFAADAKVYSVKLGDTGTDVELIQERLKELKYFKKKCTGNFGPETDKAVKAFQKRNKLEADGSVGELTREALFSEDAREAATPKSSKPKPTAKPTTNPAANPGAGSPVADPDKASADALIAYAKTLVGSKYVRGGKGPNKFDCSGFVYYCLNQVGRSTKYMTSTTWKNKCSLPKITKFSDMRPGDIIVFKRHHVGIYIGNGMMIDASSGNGKVIKRSCSTDYWKRQFACARRVF